MGDNDRSRFDPCESGHLSLWQVNYPLDRLQQFQRGLTEGRRTEDMLGLKLCLEDYTQEIAEAVVEVFQVCVTKGIQWKKLTVWRLSVNNQNRFLHFILSEARRLRQVKEVVLLGSQSVIFGDPAAPALLTNETAMELRAMMSSEQGLERLELSVLRLLPGVLSTLSQGLLANRVGTLEFINIQIMERDVGVDRKIMIENEQHDALRDGEIAYFIEVLRKNESMQHLSLCGHGLVDKHDLVTLLDAASRCRTLATLDVSHNDIGNLNLLDGVMQTHNSSRLRKLDLGGNPLGVDDRAALAKLVEVHPELQDFGFDGDEESLLITPAIQYMLDLNRSGRVLMTNPSTPLSVWATVLERANRGLFEGETNSDIRTERQASVIFGLLQGPAFAARSPNE
jgi:hypothetical protein